MCYCATHPEKMDATKQMQWQKLAKLTDMDMNTITNLEFLGVPVRKRGKATSSLTFGRKRKRAVRKVNCVTLPSVEVYAVLLGCGSWPLPAISSWQPRLWPQAQAGCSQGDRPDASRACMLVLVELGVPVCQQLVVCSHVCRSRNAPSV